MALHEDYRARADEIKEVGNHLIRDANVRGAALPRMVRDRQEGYKATPEELLRRVVETGVLDTLKRATEGLYLMAEIEESMADMSADERQAFAGMSMVVVRALFDEDELEHARVGVVDMSGESV